MTWQEDAENAIKKMHRFLDQAQDKKDKANAEYLTLCEVMDTAQQDYFTCDYGTYIRMAKVKMCGKDHNLATFKVEFPDLNPNHYWLPTCKLDPKEGCRNCKPQKPEVMESRMNDDGLDDTQKARIRELVDIKELDERVVTPLMLPDPTPAGWPYDEE